MAQGFNYIPYGRRETIPTRRVFWTRTLFYWYLNGEFSASVGGCMKLVLQVSEGLKDVGKDDHLVNYMQ